MTFGENPDPKLSLVRVLDSNGHVVPGVSGVQPVPGKPLELQVALSTPLAKGVYTVNWRSVSAVDGHVANGAFAFGVGTTPSPGSVRTRRPALHLTLDHGALRGRPLAAVRRLGDLRRRRLDQPPGAARQGAGRREPGAARRPP